jgi:hypothetical protein
VEQHLLCHMLQPNRLNLNQVEAASALSQQLQQAKALVPQHLTHSADHNTRLQAPPHALFQHTACRTQLTHPECSTPAGTQQQQASDEASREKLLGPDCMMHTITQVCGNGGNSAPTARAPRRRQQECWLNCSIAAVAGASHLDVCDKQSYQRGSPSLGSLRHWIAAVDVV